MKYTLLEMVQTILSAMDSDEVSDIDENPESKQVTDIIKLVYYNMVADLDLPETRSMFELVASGDSNKPTLMTLPSDVMELQSVRYDQKETGDTNPLYTVVDYIPWPEMQWLLNSYDTSNSNMSSFTHSVSGDTIEIKYINDKWPQWYSSYDDNTLIFDSYYSAEDTTLVANKTQCFGIRAPTFTKSNTFTPSLDHRQFMLLINEAKALAFAEMKQTVHNKAEQMARRNRGVLLRSKYRLTDQQRGFHTLPNYGRK